jgi:hypothetical protein
MWERRADPGSARLQPGQMAVPTSPNPQPTSGAQGRPRERRGGRRQFSGSRAASTRPAVRRDSQGLHSLGYEVCWDASLEPVAAELPSAQCLALINAGPTSTAMPWHQAGEDGHSCVGVRIFALRRYGQMSTGEIFYCRQGEAGRQAACSASKRDHDRNQVAISEPGQRGHGGIDCGKQPPFAPHAQCCDSMLRMSGGRG